MNKPPLFGGKEFLVFILVVILIAVAILAIEPLGGPVKRLLLPGGRTWLDLAALFGTFGAIVTALHIANRNTQRDARDKLLKAKLICAEISVRLADSIKQLRDVIELFHSDDLERLHRVNNILAAKRFAHDDAMPFRRETLVDLIPLPNEAAHRMARAADLLRLIRDIAVRYADVIRMGSSSDVMVERLHRKIDALLVEAHRELSLASAECSRAAQLQQPALPEIEG